MVFENAVTGHRPFFPVSRELSTGTVWLIGATDLCCSGRMTTSDAAEVQLSEYIKLAKLSMTVVGTSVNDERAFSAMSFVKSPERNRLDEHLEVAVRAKYQGQFTYETFPIEEGLKEWHDAAPVRGRYKAK